MPIRRRLCAYSVASFASASLQSADDNALGNVLPLRVARRKIPDAAFGLKEYLDRCGPCVSSTSGNDEDTPPSLGHSEVLSVQHSVGVPIPESPQLPEDGAHRTSMSGDTTAGADPPLNVVELAGAVVSVAGLVAEAGADGRQETRDVLEDDPLGRETSQDADDLEEESRAGAFAHAAATSCHG